MLSHFQLSKKLNFGMLVNQREYERAVLCRGAGLWVKRVLRFKRILAKHGSCEVSEIMGSNINLSFKIIGMDSGKKR